jgi:hypothetical protein
MRLRLMLRLLRDGKGGAELGGLRREGDSDCEELGRCAEETLESAGELESVTADGGRASSVRRDPPRQGWGIEGEIVETRTESQSTSFDASGAAVTSDGRVINLAASFDLAEQRVSVSRTIVREGDARLKDPLVLSWDGSPEMEGSAEIDFDADGDQDQMAFVGTGAGFLTIDANGQSRPADGAALFGALTGDGFAVLRAHDADQNGWIDEGDAVFDRLGVWSRDASGAESVRSLSELGIGAIALANAVTRYDLRGDGGDLQGQLRASSVFLSEEGAVGFAQQVDVAVQEGVPAAAGEPLQGPSTE